MEKEVGVQRIERVVNGKYDRRWIARWVDINGKKRSRSYSINKFGEEGARMRAVRTRKKAEHWNKKELRDGAIIVI